MSHAHVREAIVGRNGQVRVEGLPLLQGERVEVVVISRGTGQPIRPRYPFHGEAVEYADPFEPAAPPDEWDANQ